jgi:hypothetical protein
MINRTAHDTLLRLASEHAVIFITGPRQSGKTSLARSTFPDKLYISLDNAEILDFCYRDIGFFLSKYPDGAIIDAAQRCPELLDFLAAQVPPFQKSCSFIAISSFLSSSFCNFAAVNSTASPILQLLPFTLAELSAIKDNNEIKETLFYGFYPPVFQQKQSPSSWYSDYVLDFIERDLRKLVNVRDLRAFRIFLRSCAAACGHIVNLSKLAAECNISHNTAKAWIDALEAGHIVFLLHPHRRSYGRRIVKSPKLFFYDSGIAISLLGIKDPSLIFEHEAAAGIFESFLIAELIKSRFNSGQTSNLFFWKDSTGNEIDVIAERGDALIPLQIRALRDISSDDVAFISKWRRLNKQPSLPCGIIYLGNEQVAINGITAYPWQEINEVAPLFSGSKRNSMKKS